MLYSITDNIKKLKAIIQKVGINNIDFTSISGTNSITLANDMSYNMSEWGPLLLAVESDSL